VGCIVACIVLLPKVRNLLIVTWYLLRRLRRMRKAADARMVRRFFVAMGVAS